MFAWIPMSPLNRKLLRDIWHMRGQVLAIALVIAAGVAVYVTVVGTLRSLEGTRDAYYERHRFADVFATVKRAPESLLQSMAQIPGVKWVETRIVVEVSLDVEGMDEPAAGRLVSIPPRDRPLLNDVTLRAGRWITPGRPDEVLISEAFSDAHGFGPGDTLAATINGRRRTLEIVGIGLSPEYVYSIGGDNLMPDDRRFGVVWMGREPLEAAFDLEGAFNSVSIALLHNAREAIVIDALDRLLDPYGGTGAYGRSEQLSDQYLSSEMDGLDAMARVAPPIFLAIAAFLLNIVVTRLIAIEREQIGLLKAFGYSNLAVGWHYMKFVLLVSALGIVGGLVGGAWMGRGMTAIYTEFFRFPFLYYSAPPGVYTFAALVATAATALGALNAVRVAVRLPPAVAMAPAAPPVYRKSIFESFGLTVFAGEPTRMILRHLSRWPVRGGLAILGIAMAAAIMVAAMFSADAFEKIIEVYFFQSQRQNLTVAFVEPQPVRIANEVRRLPGVIAAEPFRMVPVRLHFEHRSRRVGVTGIVDGADISRLIDMDLIPVEVPESGLVLSSRLAQILGAGRGDTLVVEVLEGRKPVRQVVVAVVVEEYLGTAAYMRVDALNRLMQEGSRISGLYLLTDPAESAVLYRAFKNRPVVAAVVRQTAALEMFRATMEESLTIMTFFLTLFGAAIAFGVIYNTARISLSERGRELASLRVLGFTRGEVSYILLGELAVLTLVALPIGCVIGYGFAWLIATNLVNDLYHMPLVVSRATYGYAILVVLVSALISAVVVRMRIDRLDLIAVLKTRE